MKRLALALLLLASPAFGATYWVSPTGTAGASGADSTTNAKSLAWVNSNANSGDVIRFKSGTYADEINPTRTGVTSSRIRFYGFPQDPSAVVVARVRFESVCNGRGRYCTARWITSASSLDIHNCTAGEYPVSDSIVACVAQAGGLEMTGNGCVADSLTLTHTIAGAGTINDIDLGGLVVWGGGGNFACTNYSWGGSGGCSNNVIKNVTLNETLNSSEQVHTVMYAAGVNNQLVNCTFNVTINSTTGYYFGLEQYRQYGLTVSGCTWNIVVNGAIGGTSGVWCQRDSSRYSRFLNNTVSVTGGGGGVVPFLLTNSGQPSCEATTGWSLYSGNSLRNDKPGAAGVMKWQAGSRFDTLQFNVIRTNSAQPLVYNISGQDWNGTILRHNTFYTAGSTAISLNGSATGNNPRIVSGVYYSTGSTSVGNELVKVSGGIRVDSAGVYFARGGSAATAIQYNGVDGVPGSGGNFGIAQRAVWGSPRFVDSTYTTFNATPGTGSYATNANFVDGYAGAINPDVTPVGDTTPPGTVNDLSGVALSATRTSLAWTAAGDDGFAGGLVSNAYVKRAAAQIVTEGDWTGATLVGTITGGSLSSPGEQQSLQDNTVSASTTYWYAVRCDDDAGNVGAIGNSISLTTPAGGDVTAPSAISTLAATAMGGDGTAAFVTWTATGNDANSGTAATYDLRYRAGATFIEANWLGASQVSGEPTPLVAGSPQYMVVSGLAAGTQYTFAIKATDASGNQSTISNAATVTTSTPPAPLATVATRKKKLSRAVF